MTALPEEEPDRGFNSFPLPQGLSAYLDVAALSPAAPSEVAALALLRTLGLAPGSRVALPVWGCCAVAEALELCDYEVVPLDVDPDTGRLDVSSVARAQEPFELVWMADVHGLPPESAPIATLARKRDALVVEEVRESLGSLSRGYNPGVQADAVLLRCPDGRVRVGSISPETVHEAAGNLPQPDSADNDSDHDSDDTALEGWLARLPARLASQRRLAGLWESAWSALAALRLPEYSTGTRGTWPRYPVRVMMGEMDYPNAAWARWLKAQRIRTGTPARRLVHGMDPDDAEVGRQFPGAVEYLRRTLFFPCGPKVSLKEVERTVYAVDELARRESGSLP